MERLKDVRRQTVRQWLLAPHEQASSAELAFCIQDSHLLLPFVKLIQIKTIGLGRIWLPRIVLNSSPKALVRVLLV